MTEPRDDGRFEVPVAPLAGGRGQRRRAAAASLSLDVVVGGAIGLARLAANGSAASAAGRRRARRAALGSRDPQPDRGGPERAAALDRPRVEQLLDIPDRALDGRPACRARRAGRPRPPPAGMDTRQRASPTIRTIRRRRHRRAISAVPDPAPVGDQVLLLVLNAAASATGGSGGTVGTGVEQARLIDAPGGCSGRDRILPSSPARCGRPTAATVASPAPGAAGTSCRSPPTAGPRSIDVVALPGEVFLPYPRPDRLDHHPRASTRGPIPLGFSADGRWIYGAVVSPELGIVIGQFRVCGRRAPSSNRVQDFGVGRPDGFVTAARTRSAAGWSIRWPAGSRTGG